MQEQMIKNEIQVTQKSSNYLCKLRSALTILFDLGLSLPLNSGFRTRISLAIHAPLIR